MPYLRVTDPLYLALIPLLWVLTWWITRASLAGMDRGRERVALAIRWAVIALLVLALAGLQWVRPTRELCTIFVLDVSQSIAADQQDTALAYIREATAAMRAGDRAALVAFGAEALLDHAPEDSEKISKVVSLPGRSRTDIAAGIQSAMASFPPEMGKQIILFSDGNENLGNAADQTALARGNDVRISVVPLHRDMTSGEALLLRADVPRAVRAGEPFQVSILAEATHETKGTVILYRDHQPVAEQQVTLRPGKTVIGFPQIAPEQGTPQYRAVLEAPDAKDTLPDNNMVYAYTQVTGKPTVLVVEGVSGDGEQLSRALRANDVRVETVGPNRIPATLADCARYDSIIFANVPAWQMAPSQMAIIRSAVRDTGMGFAMVGGDMSFGAGGYYKTPIEETLPVSMELKKQKVLPSMALVIVIDTSGSMSATENGVPKIKLAAEAAAKAVELLQPTDEVTVLGYDTPQSFVYAVKPTKVTNKGAIINQILRLEPGGGGIYGASSLREAHSVLRKSNASIKHILFCADASDVEEAAELASVGHTLAQEKITVSAVGFGSMHDQHVPYMQDLAQAAQGEFYLVEMLSNLPQIFTRDIMQMHKGLLIEEPFAPRPHDTAHPAGAGIAWGSAPPLLGYVATSLKETPSTRQLLATHKDDPLLAAWSFGLGRSVAFTSDATARWGVHWLGWEGYPTLWTQAMRWTLRQAGTPEFETVVLDDRGRATIEVEAIGTDGAFRNLVDLTATVAYVPLGRANAEAMRRVIPLEQSAPGRYTAQFDTRDPGVYMVTVTEKDGDKVIALQSSALTIPYSPEFQQVGTNTALLAQVAERGDGVVDPKPADVFGRLRFGSRTLRNLWPGLLTVLAVLFVFDIAVRRIMVPWSTVTTAARRYLPTRPAAAPAQQDAAAPTHTTLLTSKSKSRTGRPGPAERQATLDEIRHTAEQIAQSPVTPQPDSAPPPPAPAATTSRLLAKKRERRQ